MGFAAASTKFSRNFKFRMLSFMSTVLIRVI